MCMKLLNPCKPWRWWGWGGGCVLSSWSSGRRIVSYGKRNRHSSNFKVQFFGFMKMPHQLGNILLTREKASMLFKPAVFYFPVVLYTIEKWLKIHNENNLLFHLKLIFKGENVNCTERHFTSWINKKNFGFLCNIWPEILSFILCTYICLTEYSNNSAAI